MNLNIEHLDNQNEIDTTEVSVKELIESIKTNAEKIINTTQEENTSLKRAIGEVHNSKMQTLIGLVISNLIGLIGIALLFTKNSQYDLFGAGVFVLFVAIMSLTITLTSSFVVIPNFKKKNN